MPPAWHRQEEVMSRFRRGKEPWGCRNVALAASTHPRGEYPPSWMLADLVIELAAREGLACEAAETILVTIRPRYRRGIMEHSMARLQEVKDRAESRRTSQGGNSPGGGTSQGSRGE